MHKLIFSTQAYTYLKDEILSMSNFEDGKVLIKHFPDGEMYHRILTDVSDYDVLLIGGTLDDANTIELYDMAQGIAHQGLSLYQLLFRILVIQLWNGRWKSGRS
jgi:ribose-phosphate pyrophosphokinase